MTSRRTQVGIAHNGPMTTFCLTDDVSGRSWHLCRNDLADIANGVFTRTDGRPPIELDESDKRTVIQLATKLLGEIARGEFWADLEGFANAFTARADAFGALTAPDLGRKFILAGEVYVFLGASPESSSTPRGPALIAAHLPSGDLTSFAVEEVEKALGKTTGEGWKGGF